MSDPATPVCLNEFGEREENAFFCWITRELILSALLWKVYYCC